MDLTCVHIERDTAQYFPIGNAGVKIIYLEHETID